MPATRNFKFTFNYLVKFFQKSIAQYFLNDSKNHSFLRDPRPPQQFYSTIPSSSLTAPDVSTVNPSPGYDRYTAHTTTAQQMKFSIKDFYSTCEQIIRDLVKFTEEILDGKLHFFVRCAMSQNYFNEAI